MLRQGDGAPGAEAAAVFGLKLASTGIFFHYQQGERLADFPSALGGILDKDHVFFWDAYYPSKSASDFELTTIDEAALRRTHSARMISHIKSSADYPGALFSASGTVAAAEKIFSGSIANAFVFTGYGDHHAGRDFYGGGCFFNGAVIAINESRRNFNIRRCAVIDTDAHHGDGTWDLLAADPDSLYVCFCRDRFLSISQNLNITLPDRINDDQYLTLVNNCFDKHVKPFNPEIIFWNWGYDGTAGDYGDLGLTLSFHNRLARRIKKLADAVCHGRLVVVLCGGSRRDYARLLIPRIIRVLAGE